MTNQFEFQMTNDIWLKEMPSNENEEVTDVNVVILLCPKIIILQQQNVQSNPDVRPKIQKACCVSIPSNYYLNSIQIFWAFN